jgi:hypothetical protein
MEISTFIQHYDNQKNSKYINNGYTVTVSTHLWIIQEQHIDTKNFGST